LCVDNIWAKIGVKVPKKDATPIVNLVSNTTLNDTNNITTPQTSPTKLASVKNSPSTTKEVNKQEGAIVIDATTSVQGK
jgi:hypothetical protein